MRILQLCKKFPWPARDGESVAVTHLSKALSQEGAEVSLLAMNTIKHRFEQNALPEALNHYAKVAKVPVDNRIKPLQALYNLVFSRESYHIRRFVVPAFAERLKKWLQEEEFDVVLLETLYLMPYVDVIRKYSKAKILLRSHNVEHEIWERIAANERNLLKRSYLEVLARRLKAYELEQLHRADMLLPISGRDLLRFKELGYEGPVMMLPIGLELEAYQPDYDSFERPASISFIGSLDWLPNLEGLEWFLREVWPEVQRKNPSFTLHVAGRHMPAHLKRRQLPGVRWHGEVEDARAFINAHSLMVVPLFSGSGMRVKILEGMALGKVVLTTTMGLEGILAQNGQEVLVADSAKAFVQAIEFCLNHPRQMLEIGHKARTFALQHFDSKSMAKALLKTVSKEVVQPLV